MRRRKRESSPTSVGGYLVVGNTQKELLDLQSILREGSRELRAQKLALYFREQRARAEKSAARDLEMLLTRA